ncbi:MAG TPA: hypothetical protein VE074_17530 [Jatrophihabitantaceae bacterium]|nr:hypothetical protein [Jatrophihabitantaceae bacterium]
MNDEVSTNDGALYLHVMPRHEDGRGLHPWHVFRLNADSPRITLAGSVTTCEEARLLAARDERPLRVASEAWRQMLSAGVAPTDVPDDVTLA